MPTALSPLKLILNVLGTRGALPEAERPVAGALSEWRPDMPHAVAHGNAERLWRLPRIQG